MMGDSQRFSDVRFDFNVVFFPIFLTKPFYFSLEQGD